MALAMSTPAAARRPKQRCTALAAALVFGLGFSACTAAADPGATASSVAANSAGIEHELRLPVAGGPLTIGLSTRGATALRVRLDASEAAVEDSSMVAPDEEDAAWEEVSNSLHWHGIKTSVGSLLLTPEGSLVLLDADDNILTQSDPLVDSREIRLSAEGGLVYGRGAGAGDAHELAQYGNVTPMVNNFFRRGSETKVPYYYTTDGYAALGVAASSISPILSTTYRAEPDGITWRNAHAGAFELYLMPSTTLEGGTFAYYGLVGRPRVPPLYTFGFMASRWGWQDRAYIEDTLLRFRDGKYPADAFIVDFEWFTNESDYAFTSDGKSYCDDFGFGQKTFPEPAAQLADYKDRLNFRMGGIRKPRLCNSANLAYARSKGWILPQGEPGGDPTDPSFQGYYAVGRQLNFSDPEVRAWYADKHEHHLDAGIDFWWNDEGEVDYFMFHWWSVSQAKILGQKSPGKRFYSLSRNFAPGLARLGVGVWTGDAGPTWEILAAQPGYMLNWALAGAPYVGSDIGGFSAPTNTKLLTRWYQLAVFTPLMRVHSTSGVTPHFPWLWGSEASEIMRSALELRYRLVPYHYSLAHAMYGKERLWMRPMVVAFPHDAEVASLSHQWMDGDLLVAPVVREDSVKHVVLPPGMWYAFDGSDRAQAPLTGPAIVEGSAELAELPAFVPAGSIVPLAPVVQYTDALPGGALEVRVYGGAEASFRFVEDDGETLAYEEGSVRVTNFRWDEASRELSWTSEGAAPQHGFKELYVSLYEAPGVRTASEVVALTQQGSVKIGDAQPRRLRGAGSAAWV